MKVLVAIGNSVVNRNILEKSLNIVNRQDATFLLLSIEELIAVSSTSFIPNIFEDNSILETQSQSELIQVEEQRIASVLDWAEHLCQQVGVQAITRIEFGDPKHLICRIAQEENCDLIVVGSHGYGGVRRALLGSVSDYVVHQA